MNIRMIAKSDFPAWIELRHLLWSDHTWPELESEAITLFQGSQDYGLFVAEDTHNLIGFIEVSIHESAPGCFTNKIGYIEGWYVMSEHRRRGIGRALADAAETWALHRNCREMASDTNDRYPISPIAHRALGYEEVEPMRYRKWLGEPG